MSAPSNTATARTFTLLNLAAPGRAASLRVMAEAEELGRGGRLRGAAAGELVAAAYAAESAHGPRLAHGLSLAGLAHAVALVEGGGPAGGDARGRFRGPRSGERR